MKAYRKKWIGILMAMMFCFSPVSVLAAELPVTISSGLNMEAEEVECTFEEETEMLKKCSFSEVKCIYTNQKFSVIVSIK